MILRPILGLVDVLARAAFVAGIVLVLAGTASADTDPMKIPTDHVPAWVFYSVLAAGSAAGATMGKVIHYLWVRLDEHARLAEERLLATQNTHRADLKAVTDLLQKEQAERRQDVERLKKEQTDVMREVMTQIAASTEAIEDSTQTLHRLMGSITQEGP
ncbi:MAG: hypothetical protein IT371_30630 [Deltaproteobacteria bacterium]|nr:hypothetical protein [Deltaproteobacteria bacterium]